MVRLIAVIFIGLVGCAPKQETTNGPKPSNRIPDSACVTAIDNCTHQPNVACVMRRFDFGNPANDFDVSRFEGKPCLLTFEDWQQDPGCDTEHPDKLCGGGWSGGNPIPCCSQAQGPGAPANL